jgi:hypothetical protein
MHVRNIVIYETSARRYFSRMGAQFEARATKERVLHLRECAEYVQYLLKRTLYLICNHNFPHFNES